MCSKSCDNCVYHVCPPKGCIHCYNYAGYGEACDGFWLASSEQIEEGRKQQIEAYRQLEKEHPIRMAKKKQQD